MTPRSPAARRGRQDARTDHHHQERQARCRPDQRRGLGRLGRDAVLGEPGAARRERRDRRRRDRAGATCRQARAVQRDGEQWRVEPVSAYELALTPAAGRAMDNLPIPVAIAALELTTGELAERPHRVGKAPLEGGHAARRGDHGVLYQIREQVSPSSMSASAAMATAPDRRDCPLRRRLRLALVPHAARAPTTANWSRRRRTSTAWEQDLGQRGAAPDRDGHAVDEAGERREGRRRRRGPVLRRVRHGSGRPSGWLSR
jgi:mRNA interferase RelE/StbE